MPPIHPAAAIDDDTIINDKQLDLNGLRKYAMLMRRKEALTKVTDEVKKEIAQLERNLIDNMIECGVPQISVGNGKAIKVAEMVYAKIRDEMQVPNALRAAGLHELIEEKANTRRISAYVRECVNTDTSLPASFDGVIEANPTWSLKIVKG